MNLDEPRAGASILSDAAELPLGTIQAWIRDGIVPLAAADVDAHGSGSRRQFTLRTALRFAIAGALVRGGVHHRTASEWAARFTDSGFGATQTNSDSRNPGELFEGNDQTLLVIKDGLPRVMRSSSFDARPSGHHASTVLNLNPIVDRVTARLVG